MEKQLGQNHPELKETTVGMGRMQLWKIMESYGKLLRNLRFCFG